MLETVSHRYQGSCMMVMRRSDSEVTFLASAFLVHPEGYLLTVSRMIDGEDDLVVVPPQAAEDFVPVTREEVAPVPVEVVARDIGHDVALLKLTPELEINMPEHVLGTGNSDPRGALLMSLGVPYGYYRMHSVVAAQSVLSSRLQSRVGTNMIIFDRRVQSGDIGGPLISVTSGMVIGIVGGVFDPVELENISIPAGSTPINSDLSYASAIEYGDALLTAALGR
ncbi:MAG: trypsin-like peptidase domain-containing protein [Alkalispirochaeta sp.]